MFKPIGSPSFKALTQIVIEITCSQELREERTLSIYTNNKDYDQTNLTNEIALLSTMIL